MPSPNSPQENSEYPRFSIPELVSTEFIEQVKSDWDARLSAEQLESSSLVIATDWKFQEALTWLCECVLERLGVECPSLTAFSLIGADPERTNWDTCELVLMWSAVAIVEPDDVLDDCIVTCVVEFPLPRHHLFVSKADVQPATIAEWASKLSVAADDLPEKEM